MQSQIYSQKFVRYKNLQPSQYQKHSQGKIGLSNLYGTTLVSGVYQQLSANI